MAVTLNGSVGTKVYQSAVTTKDFTFTVSSGSNLALIVTLNFGSIVSGVSITWDQGGTNQAMTQLVGQFAAAPSVIFGLRNPAVGTLTGRVSWTVVSEVFIEPTCWAGVNQSSDGAAFPNSANSASGTSASTINVTSATGDIVVGCESSTISQGTSTGTLLFDDHASGAIINAMAQYDSGASSVTIGNSGSNSSLAAIDIAAAAGGGSSDLLLRRRRAA